MKQQGTLRRTLAMLLVIVFALSNMGLAEAAELVVESIPAVEASIEEPAVEEAASVAEPEAEAPAEAEAPDDGAPEEGAPEADAPGDGAPEEGAPEVEAPAELSVEAYPIDEDSLFADALPEDWPYELSYQWEKAESEDGEFAAIEGATEAVYVDTAAGRCDYVYRCVVTSEGQSVVSAATTFWGEPVAEQPEEDAPAEDAEADEEEAIDAIPMDESIEMVTLGAVLDGVTVEVKDADVAGSDGADKKETLVYNANAKAGDSVALTATVNDSTGSLKTPKYEWYAGSDSEAAYVDIAQTGDGKTATITAKSAADLNAVIGKTINIYFRVTEQEEGDTKGNTAVSEAYKITILPALTQDQVNKAFKFVDDDDAEVKEFGQPASGGPESKAATAKLIGLNPGYTVEYTVDATASTTTPAVTAESVKNWLTVDETGNKLTNGEITVKKLDKTNNQFTSKDGQTFTIKATVNNGGTSKITATKTLTIFPQAASVKIMNGETEVSSTSKLTVATYDKVTLTAKFSPDADVAKGDNAAEIASQIKVLGGPAAEDAWTFTKNSTPTGAPDITGTASGNSFTFIPTAAGKYDVKFKSDIDNVDVGDTQTNADTLTVKALPEKVEFKDGGAATEITKSYFVGETTVDKIELDFGDTEDPYTEGIEWVVDDPGTGAGSTAKHYLTYTTGKDPKKGQTVVEIETPIRSEGVTKNGKVTFTITAKYMPEGADQPQTATLKYTINILTEATGTITEDNIKFDPEIIGQPSKSSAGKPPKYAQSKASIQHDTLGDYGVQWEIVTTDDTNAKKFVSINDDTSILTAADYSNSDHTATAWGTNPEGKEIKVQAKIPLKKGASAEADFATATKSIFVRPVPATIGFAQMQGGTEQAISGDTLQVPKGTTLTLKLKPTAAAGIPSTIKLLDHTLTASYAPDKEDDGTTGTDHDMTVSANDSTVALDVSKVGGYTITATAKVGDEELATSQLRVEVVESAADAKVTPSSTTATLYNGSTINFKVEGIDKDGKVTTASIGKPKWTLAVTNLASNDNYVSETQYATSTTQIILYDEERLGTDIALSIPTSFNSAKIKTGAKITVTVEFPGTNIKTQTLTYDLKVLPTDVALSNSSTIGELDLKAYHSYDANGYVQSGDNFIAQGDEASISYKTTDADGETTKAKAYEDLQKNYTLKYSLSKTDAANTKQEDIDKYVTIDQTGKIVVKPLESGDKPNNAITSVSSGDSYTITYALDGIETVDNSVPNKANLSITQDIKLVKAPANVAIKHVTSLPNADAIATDTAIPKMLTINTSADLIGVLVPDTGAITAGEAPALSVSTTTKDTFDHPNKHEADASQGKAEFWRLTAKPTSKTDMLKVTITASQKNCTKTATADIYINGETIDLEDTTGSKTCTSGTNAGNPHVWVLAAVQDNPKGHIYECSADSDSCTAKSKPVKHSNFSIVWNPSTAEKDKKPEDVLWKGKSGLPGEVDCAICSFTCDHTYKTGTVEYKNSDYHEGICDTCGNTIRQAHVDEDTDSVCDVCEGSAAKVDFGTTQPVLLLVGKTYTPENLSVDAGDSYTVVYSVEGESAKYLTLVSKDTGEVKGAAASPKDFDPVLTANITTTQGDKTTTVKGELKFSVKEPVTAISIASDDNKNADGSAYLVIPKDGDGKVLKLTATISPNADEADLSDYTWQFDGDTNGSGNLKFVTPKTDAEGNVVDGWDEVTAENAQKDKLNETVIYVMTGASPAKTAEDKPVVVEYARKDEPKDPAGKLAIDMLELTSNDLTEMISFNSTYPGAKSDIDSNDKKQVDGVSIIQGQSMPVSLLQWKEDTADDTKHISSAFDSRYGTVEFSFEPATEADDGLTGDESPYTVTVKPEDKNRWLKVTTTDATAGTGTVQSLTSSLASLADKPYTAAFKVTATVTHDWLSATRTDPETTEKLAAQTTASRIVWIVPNTTTAKFQYKNKNDGTWTDFPATGLDVDEDESIDVKLTIVANGKPTIAATAVTWNPIAEKNGAFAKTADGKEDTDAERTFTVAREGADDSITISGAYPGLSIPPVKLNVKRLIHEITLTCDATAYNAGEEDTTEDGVSNPKSFTITAAADTQDHNDKLIWTLMAKDGHNEITDIKFEDVPGTDGLTKKITLPGKRTMSNLAQIGPEVVITVTAEKSKDKDGNPIQKTHTVKIFQTPEGANNGLEITPVKALRRTDSKLVLTVGESTKFSHIGWESKEDTIYGASAEASVFTPEVEYATLKNAEEDAGKDVITVKDGVITAVAEGTAQITIKAFNYPDSAKKTLDVEVTSAVDTVELSSTAKLEKTYTIGVNEPEAERTTIAKNSFVAYRNVTDSNTGTTTKEEATDAAITLVSDNACLEIVDAKKDGTDVWQLVGKSIGTAHVYAYVNDTANTKSDPIEVKVEAAPEGIHFEQNGVPVGAQLTTSLEQPETFVLTAVTEPVGATGEITIKATNPEVIDLKVEGNVATLTPLAKAGKSEVTAEIYNPNFSGTESLLNPSKLVARVEILVTTEAGGTTTPGTTGVSLVGKKAIGPDETTQLVATGVEASKTVTWTADPETAATLTEDAAHKSVSIKPATTGKVTVTATVDGTAIGSETIYLLTAPEEIEFTRGDGQTLTMAVGETLKLSAKITKGYDFTPEVESEASGVEKDDSNLFTYSSNLESRLTVTGENGEFVAKAISKPTKKQSVVLTVKAGKVTKDIAVVINAKNKKFSIGAYNGSTLYMAPGEEKPIAVTYSPKTSPANLEFAITDASGEAVEEDGDLSLTQTATGITVKVAENASTEDAVYNVTVKAAGYTDHADQSFTVVVNDAATESETLAIAVRKVGADGTGYGDTAATDSVTVVKSEQLQAYFVDNGKPVAGTASWTAQSKADKKKAEINTTTGLIKVKGTSGSVTISGSVNGIAAKSITLNLAKAPKATLSPNVKTRTVAIGEKFQLGMTLNSAYPDAKADEFYSISWTDFKPTKVEDEETPNLWTFEQAGVTTATLKPLWGGTAQKVKFTVLDTEAADTFEVPEEVFVAAGAKTIVRAEMDGYANLTWLNGTDPITTKDKATVADKKIKVKTLANDEVQITAAKGAVGAEIGVMMLGDAEPKKIKITVKTADTQFPAETKLVFDKPVITVGESTIVGLDFGDSDAPVGNITYSFKSVKGAGKVSIKNNVVTGKTPGVATVVAKLGSGKNADTKTGTIYVLPKAKIQTTLNPTKMGAGETLTMGVTITDYVAANVPDENLKDQVNTVGMLTVESNSSNIAASLEAVDGTTNEYALTLKAISAEKTSKGKFTTTTITLRLSNGQKKTMKIQVVEPADENAVYMRDVITMAPKTTVKLNAAIAEGTAYAANFDWHFIDEDSAANAAKHFLTLADGKLSTTRDSTATTADEEIVLEGSYGETTKTIQVVIANAKAGKNQFKLVQPNRDTVYIGEKILGKIEFNPGVGGGDITWKSSKSKIISVDKAAGLYTVIGPAGKTSVVSATVNGKSSTQAKKTLRVAPAPTKIAFDQADITLTAGGEPINLTSHVLLDNAKLSGDYSGTLVFETNSNLLKLDKDTGVISAAPAVEESAIVTVTSFNGLTAKILVVVGQGSGTTPGGDPTDKTPNTIELYSQNATPLIAANLPVVLTEGGATFKPVAIVKNKDDYALSGANVTWDFTPKSETNPFISIAADGTVTPLRHTLNSDNTHTNVTVTATSGAATASYTLNIEADKTKASNLALEIRNNNGEVMDALLVGDGATADSTVKPTGSIIVNIPDTKLRDIADETSVKFVKSAETGIVKVTQTSGQNEFKFEALKAGTDTLTFQVTLNNGETVSFDQDVNVNELPAKDALKITDASGTALTPDSEIVIGMGEKPEFHVSIQNFNGTPGTELAVAVTDTAGAPVPGSPIENAAVADEEDALKYTFDSDASGITANKTYKVEVKLYEQRYNPTIDCPTASFKVTVKHVPVYNEYKITGSPEIEVDSAAPNYKLTLGLGESVTLSAAKSETYDADNAGVWTKGLVWEDITSYATDATPADKATLESAGTDAVKVTYSKAFAAAGLQTQDIKIELHLKDDPKTSSSKTKLATVTITYRPLPKKTSETEKNYTASVVDEEEVPLTEKTIGENEKFTASVKFDTTGGTDKIGYATNLTWKANEKFVTLKQNGLSCEFTGKASTGGTIPVQVYYGSLLLGEFKLTVNAAPTLADLDLKEYDADKETYTKTYGKYLSASANAAEKNNPLKVGVELATGKSAVLLLECTNPCVVIENDTKPNTWKISWNQTPEVGTPTDAQKNATSATLKLSSPENNLYRNFNLTIDREMKMGNNVTSVESAKPLDPVKTFPNGFKSADGEKGATAAEVAQNQGAITASVDASSDTINLSGSTEDMATWVSEEYEKSKSDSTSHNWYCLIIETGFDDISTCYRAVALDTGSGITEPQSSAYEKIPDDENGALNGFGKGCLVEWLPLDKAKTQNVSQMKIYVNTSPTDSGAKSFTIDFSKVTAANP